MITDAQSDAASVDREGSLAVKDPRLTFSGAGVLVDTGDRCCPNPSRLLTLKVLAEYGSNARTVPPGKALLINGWSLSNYLEDVRQAHLRTNGTTGPSVAHLVAGHFPGAGVYPGVLQVEMIAQLALCLLYFRRAHSPAMPPDAAPQRVPGIEIYHATFGADVRPSDGLTLLVRLLTADEETACCAGQVLQAETVCAFAVIEFHSMPG